MPADKVLAGIATVIIVGLVVEFGLFRVLEAATIRRWGLQRSRTSRPGRSGSQGHAPTGESTAPGHIGSMIDPI
jgi:hypothetical protein